MAEAIVSIVVGRLTDLLTDEAQLLRGVRDEIEQVVTKLRWMKTFLPDADLRISEYNIENLVKDIRELAYYAEHVVETFLLKALFTQKTIQWMNIIKFSSKLKDIETKMSLLSNRFRDYNIKSTLVSPESSSASSGTPGKLKRFYSYPTLEPEIFVGFQGLVDQLVGHLVDESDDRYPLISICGMGGLGKTTLAQKIYNHSTIKTYFAGLAWVSISQKWQTTHVLQRILICLVPERRNEILNFNDDNLVENLLQIQEEKKCLIVLDDIWSTDAWDSLKAAFTNEQSVSKLMITSRHVDVALHVNPKGFIYQPQCLSAEESWELLKLKALPRGGDCLDITRDPKRMEELGREMVGNCAGLPLAIVILGGILVTKPSLIEWEKVYNDSLSSLKRGKGLGGEYQRELFSVLVWSYNDLPPQLKPCFLYLGKFREDECIEAETLYELWMAEGMVLSSDKREGETMMQVAESYLGELALRSMVQVRFNNMESSFTKIEYCFCHDLMRDLSLAQAEVEKFFEFIDTRKGSNFHLNPYVDSQSTYGRQLVVYFDRRHAGKKAISLKKVDQEQYRSLLFFNEVILLNLNEALMMHLPHLLGSEAPRAVRSQVPQVVRSHVVNFRFLRVFAMENVELDRQETALNTLNHIKLGRAFGSLLYLRYFSTRGTNLLYFPSIQNLALLQTFRLDDSTGAYKTYFPPWLSRNILGKLGRLRHLYLPRFSIHSSRKNFKLHFDGLTKLETLENFNTDWCEIKDLPKLTSLHKLRLNVRGSCYDVEEMMAYLSSPSCLRYLALSIYECDLALGNGPDIL